MCACAYVQLMSTDTDGTKQLLQLQQDVERAAATLEELLERHSLDPRVRQWLRASAYACYELLAVCRDEQQSTGWQVGVKWRVGGCIEVERGLALCAAVQAWEGM